eukprot:1903667-Rhodomonas_salina.1
MREDVGDVLDERVVMDWAWGEGRKGWCGVECDGMAGAEVGKGERKGTERSSTQPPDAIAHQTYRGKQRTQVCMRLRRGRSVCVR